MTNTAAILLITSDPTIGDAVAATGVQFRITSRLGVAAASGVTTTADLIIIGHDQLNTAAAIGGLDVAATVVVAFTTEPTASQRAMADMAGATRTLVLPGNPDDLEYIHFFTPAV